MPLSLFVNCVSRTTGVGSVRRPEPGPRRADAAYLRVGRGVGPRNLIALGQDAPTRDSGVRMVDGGELTGGDRCALQEAKMNSRPACGIKLFLRRP